MGSQSSKESPDVTKQNAEEPKQSLYKRYKSARMGRDNVISESDLRKFTGRDSKQMQEWAKDREGVGGNQLNESATATVTTTGVVGWGSSSNAALKFPPASTETQQPK
jgi:hypothetical protein